MQQRHRLLAAGTEEILRAPAARVDDPDEARFLVAKLDRAWSGLQNCIGLACPQIGISKQVAIVRDRRLGVFINLVNPEIVSSSNPFLHEGEGCMSYPGRRWNVPRFSEISIENDCPWPLEDGLPYLKSSAVWSMNGGRLVRQKQVFSYLLAPEHFGGVVMVAIQHEIDHLRGVVLPDRPDAVLVRDGSNRSGDRFEDGAQQHDAPAARRKIGRNELCPCGSGKKYKRCCGGSQ